MKTMKIQPIQSLYNKNDYIKSQQKFQKDGGNKMNFIYTSDINSKEWLEKNNFELIQTQENESGKVYVFKNKPNIKFSKELGLQLHFSNKLRF